VASSASNSSSRPVIGLTTYLEQAKTGVWDVPASFLPKVYFDAINRAGGIALLIPPQALDGSDAGRILDSLDGLIICGGKDVNPALYGQDPHPTTDEPRHDRDALEDALLSAALERDMPFLGICRGAQIFNVNRGGTLIQHLPDVIGDDRYQKGGGVFSTVDAEVTPGTKLAEVLGGTEPVAAEVYHHQAIDHVAPGVTVSARTADGVIEAVELTDKPFALAVQWHPEETPEDLRLFVGLVEAARNYRSNA
jgi:putative glutamine amidotransferase